MPEARGSIPRGRARHDGMAQRLEQLSHKQLAVCSTHTPVTKRKEVVLVKRQTQIRVARRPRRPVIVFRFRGRVFPGNHSRTCARSHAAQGSRLQGIELIG
jgi:hypothetical protein